MDSGGQRHINFKNLQMHGEYYTALQTAENEGMDHHTDLVRGGRTQHEDGTVLTDAESGYPHKQPRSNATQIQKDSYKKIDALHTHTRYYATLPEHGVSTLQPHEPRE